MLASSIPTSSRQGAAARALTRERFGWQPEQPGLIEDVDQGHYFKMAASVAA